MLSIARRPVKAVIRRVPAATLSSPMILKMPTRAVLLRCVPPQSSLLKSPAETMRTTSGYFSPKSIMAPLWRASASGRFVQPIGSPASILPLTSFSMWTSSSSPTADGLAKSNRSQSSSTFEPCWRACLPRCFCRA